MEKLELVVLIKLGLPTGRKVQTRTWWLEPSHTVNWAPADRHQGRSCSRGDLQGQEEANGGRGHKDLDLWGMQGHLWHSRLCARAKLEDVMSCLERLLRTSGRKLQSSTSIVGVSELLPVSQLRSDRWAEHWISDPILPWASCSLISLYPTFIVCYLPSSFLSGA